MSAGQREFCWKEDWLQPLRSMEKLGPGNIDELVIEVEYCLAEGDGSEELNARLVQLLEGLKPPHVERNEASTNRIDLVPESVWNELKQISLVTMSTKVLLTAIAVKSR